MATDISMCSNALILLGEEPIQSLDDDAAAANLYASTYDHVLGFHPWSFSLKSQELSRNASSDIEGWTYSYNLPSDMIRLWQTEPNNDYTIVGNSLYSNESKIVATYIRRPPETDLPAYFVKMMEYKLASDFAISVTEDDNKNQLFERKYLKALSMCLAADSQSRPQVQIQHKPFSNYHYESR